MDEPKFVTEAAERAARASPGPWRWGDDADAIGEQHDQDTDDEYAGEKYLDGQLYDRDGSEILPLRIDHYRLIYDGYWIGAEDRSHVAHSRTDIPLLVRHIRELRSTLQDLLALRPGSIGWDVEVERAEKLLARGEGPSVDWGEV